LSQIFIIIKKFDPSTSIDLEETSMKRNFSTLVAMMVSALFVGATIAEAADVKFGGQLRPRFEVNEQSDFNDATHPDFWISQRTRLQADVSVNADTGAFIQLQSNRTWGQGDAFTTGGAGGVANDINQDVGLHQGYFTLKNFYSLPVDVKVGRQEIVLDGHRIFGNTDWAQGANSHDAIAVTHSAGDHTIMYGYSLAAESRTVAVENTGDLDVHFIYGQQKGILGGALSLYYVNWNNNTNNASGGASDGFHTLGLRQAGQLYGLDYRVEGYYQTGDTSSNISGIYTPSERAAYGDATATPGDLDAYLWGVRVGKKFNDVMWKPSLTLWYDQISGNTDEDFEKGDQGQWMSLFDTGHKFYGFMDLFGDNGAASGRLGLQDLAIKASVQPAANWSVNADYHFFSTNESPDANPKVATDAGAYRQTDAARNMGNSLGSEIDLTVVNKYNDNVNISIGYSYFDADTTYIAFNQGTTSVRDNPQWAYVMFDVKF
jgi:hypothetical protein